MMKDRASMRFDRRVRMESSLTIRDATLGDFQDIQLLFRKMFDIFYEDQDIEYPYKESGKRYLEERIKHGIAIVVMIDNKVVGFLTGSIEQSLDFKTYEKYGFIHNMFILEEFRSTGIGKRLVETFIDRCKELGISYIHTDSDANQMLINFYTGIGFKISGVSYKMKLS
jgi:GNAT superfamily N-acetyltransferase